MRKNLPVTGTEHRLNPGTHLVSTTDTKGRITYCNDAFCEVAGYERDELVGRPHNMIRHPDMPEEAFRDLWATIQKGKLWRGIVKNRCKNGDHYWVVANVTPLYDGDRIVAYLSVRGVPTREEVAACEALYATMRAEAERGRLVHRVFGGEVCKTTLTGRVRRAMALGQKSQMTWFAIGMAAIVFGGQVLAHWLGLGLWAAAAQAALVGGICFAGARLFWLRPLQAMERFAARLAACDMTREQAPDFGRMFSPIRMALSQVSQNVRAMLSDTREEIESLRLTVGELSEAKLELSSRTETQASALEETASAMEQMTASVRSSAEQARSSARTADEARDVTSRSHEAVGDVVRTMDQIGAASNRVTEIIEVIESIAFQTNILALNASVEAARAGEQGRGFAVVAAEVRALAQRSAGAAKEIRGLIAEAVEQVEAGRAVTSRARETIDAALAQVQTMGRLATEIADGAAEQSEGIAQVNEAISHMDSVTQQNAAMVEELAASAGALSGQADVLADSVRLFRLTADDLHAERDRDAVAMRREAKGLSDVEVGTVG